MLFPTTIVGSYPQPDWLIDREKLSGRFPPRVRAKELWRVAEPYLKEAMDDATLVAIRAQEQAGLDIITDGEIRRESYSNRFATALGGIDVDNYGTALDRTGEANPVPRIAGPAVQTSPRSSSERSAPASTLSKTESELPERCQRWLPRINAIRPRANRQKVWTMVSLSGCNSPSRYPKMRFPAGKVASPSPTSMTAM